MRVVAIMMLVALAACGNDQSGEPLVNNAQQSGSDSNEQPGDGALRQGIEFVLQEDSTLVATLHKPGSLSGSDTTRFRIVTEPQNAVLVLDQDGQTFTYTPNADFFGIDHFRFADSRNQTYNAIVRIAGVDDAPILSSDLPRVAAQGVLFTAQLSARDADGDVLRYEANGLPGWLTLNRETGELSGLPAQSDIGVHTNIVLRVIDSSGLNDELNSFSLEVIDINDRPTLNTSQIPQELDAGQFFFVSVFPDDADGDDVVLEVEPNPFLTTEIRGGSLAVMVGEVAEVMSINLVIRATDTKGQVAREIVPLTLYPVSATGHGRTLFGRAAGSGVHLVMLGDGYRDDQQYLLREHAEAVIDELRGDAGIARHMGLFNIHMIETVSIDSGIDDNDVVDSRDTAFDSRYNCLGVARLICADQLKIFLQALDNYPDLDQLVLLVNDRRYGGSGNRGGGLAIASGYAPEIVLHEMGHSIAGLADEYVDGVFAEASGELFVEGRYANVSANSSADQVPWRHWIDQQLPAPTQEGQAGVGVFEGAFYQNAGLYRSSSNSRMRDYSAPFGRVNSEQWVLGLYAMSNVVRGFSPVTHQVSLAAGQTQAFSVSPYFELSVQSVEWSFDGVPVEGFDNATKLQLMPAVGEHTLRLSVNDVSGAVRLPRPNASSFEWNWRVVVQ
ncbi:MAG: M64 family metallopeptidase [Granulosicoccus sp.]